MGRRVALVSGAGGFIGRWSVPRLLALGYDVHAVIGRTAHHEIPPPLRGATLHRADLLDPASVDALLSMVKPSHLLHFAWIATPGLYGTSVQNYRWVAAGERLLQSFHAAGGVRAVMAGSSAEYDWARCGVCDERRSPLAVDAAAPGNAGAADSAAAGGAATPYAECKIAMQEALARFGKVHGMSTAWGRIFFQFGPDEHPDRLVAHVIISLLGGRNALCSHGRQIRSFLHVADVGSAFAALLDSEVEGPVNIGSGERISLAQLVEQVASQIGRPDLLRLGARSTSPSEPALLVPDVQRLHTEVGWRPHFTLTTGIADTIAWWRDKLAGGDGDAATR
jgi:nucleoside-diphosphate-sugar epimerase